MSTSRNSGALQIASPETEIVTLSRNSESMTFFELGPGKQKRSSVFRLFYISERNYSVMCVEISDKTLNEWRKEVNIQAGRMCLSYYGEHDIRASDQEPHWKFIISHMFEEFLMSQPTKTIHNAVAAAIDTIPLLKNYIACTQQAIATFGAHIYDTQEFVERLRIIVETLNIRRRRAYPNTRRKHDRNIPFSGHSSVTAMYLQLHGDDLNCMMHLEGLLRHETHLFLRGMEDVEHWLRETVGEERMEDLVFKTNISLYQSRIDKFRNRENKVAEALYGSATPSSLRLPIDVCMKIGRIATVRETAMAVESGSRSM